MEGRRVRGRLDGSSRLSSAGNWRIGDEIVSRNRQKSAAGLSSGYDMIHTNMPRHCLG